jgi:hypothetical protein
MTKKNTFCEEKYTLIRHDDGRMEALRYGEPWRELTGDHLIAEMAEALDQATAQNTQDADIPTLDLSLIQWESIQKAARESRWIPPEYFANDWVSDVCCFLRDGIPGGDADKIALANTAGVAAERREDMGDEELPGMWSSSDFTGGDPDERCHAERAVQSAAEEAVESSTEKEVDRLRRTLVDSETYTQAVKALRGQAALGGDPDERSHTEREMHGESTLLPCPCGSACDTDEGPYQIDRSGELFRLDCQDAECGWSIIAPSAKQCLVDWNRRAHIAALTPAGEQALDIAAIGEVATILSSAEPWRYSKTVQELGQKLTLAISGGQAGDAATKYRWICDRFNGMKTSESERFLECLGIEGSVYRPLDELIHTPPDAIDKQIVDKDAS